MESKLTLKLNSDIIFQAKEYARSKEQSLSKLIEAYLQSLVSQSNAKEEEDELTPFVKSFRTGDMPARPFSPYGSMRSIFSI